VDGPAGQTTVDIRWWQPETAEELSRERPSRRYRRYFWASAPGAANGHNHMKGHSISAWALLSITLQHISQIREYRQRHARNEWHQACIRATSVDTIEGIDMIKSLPCQTTAPWHSGYGYEKSSGCFERLVQIPVAVIRFALCPLRATVSERLRSYLGGAAKALYFL
jgi:hypothetical protein